jgi:hypothetical protein
MPDSEIQMLPEIQMPDSETQMLTLSTDGGKLAGAIKKSKYFYKKNYYFICIPLIYKLINNLDIK